MGNRPVTLLHDNAERNVHNATINICDVVPHSQVRSLDRRGLPVEDPNLCLAICRAALKAVQA